MKILVTADWHFHAYKAHSTMRDGMNSRLADIRDTWMSAVEIGISEGCEIMTVSGDLFHVRGQLRPSVINVVQSLVRRVIEAGMEVVVIPGNHDMESYQGGDTAVDFLSAIEGVHNLDGGGIVNVAGLKIAGIPYQHIISDFIERAKYLVGEKPDICLIHQGVDDFKPSETMPDFGLTLGMVREIFGEIPVFCGHYHNHKVARNIVNIGAPLQHTFGDEGQDRGVVVFDTEKALSTFHPISRSPKFVTVEDESTKWMKGDFVRIKAYDIKIGEKMALHAAKTAGDVVVVCRKEFKVDESRAVLEPGPVLDMLTQYIAATPELAEHGPSMIEMYNEVCL